LLNRGPRRVFGGKKKTKTREGGEIFFRIILPVAFEREKTGPPLKLAGGRYFFSFFSFPKGLFGKPPRRTDGARF